MVKSELMERLNQAHEQLMILQKKYDGAIQALLQEYERDGLREEGSEYRERQRESHQQSLRNNERMARKSLDEQRSLVEQLQHQLDDS